MQDGSRVYVWNKANKQKAFGRWQTDEWVTPAIWNVYGLKFLESYTATCSPANLNPLYLQKTLKAYLATLGTTQPLEFISGDIAAKDAGVFAGQTGCSKASADSFIGALQAYLQPVFDGSASAGTTAMPLQAGTTTTGTMQPQTFTPQPVTSSYTQQKTPSVMGQKMQTHLDSFIDKGINKLFNRW